MVRPRKRLTSDQYLEHIYKPNCPSRDRDAAWHDYVNLSMTKINARLFGISSGNWHRDLDGWWCILAFSTSILTHPGVYFTTTNNMYSGVQRGLGESAFEAMFAPKITRWTGESVTRPATLPPCQPTCQQAEVLYPGDLPLASLQYIYLRDAEHLDSVAGMCGALNLAPIECRINPSLFS
jgi:hypothetical protein